MEFVLTGYGQDNNIRRYLFEGVAADRTRKQFAVHADLTLIHKYDIPLQELPLLCRHLLEGYALSRQSQTLTFTEKDMLGYVSHRAAAQEAAEQKRRAHRKPPSSRVGLAWRSSSSRFGKVKDIS